MKVDYQDSPRPSKKRRSRRKKMRAAILACGVLVLILGITLTLMLTVFFNVERVKVLGSSIYSSEEIVHSSGIFMGDNILRLDADEIELRLETALPYIKEAKVLKSLPYSVGIKVTPAVEAYVLECADGIYVSDSDYKLLRTAEQLPEGLLKIKGISSEKFTLGKSVDFADKQQRDTLQNLIKICNDRSYGLTYINVESLIDISFVIDGRLLVKLGSYSDMSGKLNHLAEMLKSIDTDIKASISLENWSTDNKKAVLKYGNFDELSE